MENNFNSQNLADIVCSLLGVKPENVSVNCEHSSIPATENTPETEVVNVEVGVRDENTTDRIEFGDSIPSPRTVKCGDCSCHRVSEEDRTGASGVDLTEYREKLNKIADDFFNQRVKRGIQNSLPNSEELKGALSNLAANLSNFYNTIRDKYQDAMNEISQERENVECPDTDKAEAEDFCSEELEAEQPIKSSAIREKLRQKFAAVKQEAEAIRFKKQFQDLNTQRLIDAVIDKISNEQYSSLTNDIDADNAGIAVVLSKDETDALEASVQSEIGYPEYLELDFITDKLLPDVTAAVVKDVEFESGYAFLNSIDGAITFKFLF